MSEPDFEREWRFYIEDMIGFCERIQSFTQGIIRELLALRQALPD